MPFSKVLQTILPSFTAPVLEMTDSVLPVSADTYSTDSTELTLGCLVIGSPHLSSRTFPVSGGDVPHTLPLCLSVSVTPQVSLSNSSVYLLFCATVFSVGFSETALLSNDFTAAAVSLPPQDERVDSTRAHKIITESILFILNASCHKVNSINTVPIKPASCCKSIPTITARKTTAAMPATVRIPVPIKRDMLKS